MSNLLNTPLPNRLRVFTKLPKNAIIYNMFVSIAPSE